MNIEEIWEELRFEITSCKVAHFGDRAEKILLGAGNRSSRVIFIGDDPNLFEDEKMSVQEGKSGHFFKSVCDLVDINLEKIYLTNIVKCNAKLSDLTKNEQEQYREFLEMEIALINPDIIVTLGKNATEFLLKKSINIDEIHGDIFNWEGEIRLIPLFAPDYLLRQNDRSKQSPKWLNWQDMKLIKKEMGNYD